MNTNAIQLDLVTALISLKPIHKHQISYVLRIDPIIWLPAASLILGGPHLWTLFHQHESHGFQWMDLHS